MPIELTMLKDNPALRNELMAAATKIINAPYASNWAADEALAAFYQRVLRLELNHRAFKDGFLNIRPNGRTTRQLSNTDSSMMSTEQLLAALESPIEGS